MTIKEYLHEKIWELSTYKGDFSMMRYGWNLINHIQYSNYLIPAIKMKKNALDSGGSEELCGIIDSCVDKLVDAMALNDLNLKKIDQNKQSTRDKISKKLNNYSPKHLDKFIDKYFNKMIKSGQNMYNIAKKLNLGIMKGDYGEILNQIKGCYDKWYKN